MLFIYSVFYDSSPDVRIGIIHEDSFDGQTVSDSRVYVHPNYTSTGLTTYDVALLRLPHKLLVDNYTRPICLGNEQSLKEIYAMGDKADCFITGFGYTENYLANGKYSSV